MLELPLPKCSSGTAELKRPEEVAGLFEVGADGENFMNEVFHAHDTVFAQVFLHDSIVCQSNTLWVAVTRRFDLPVSPLVDEFANALQVRVAISYERLNDSQHLHRSFSKANKNTRIDLKKSEELQGLPFLGIDLVDTASMCQPPVLFMPEDGNSPLDAHHKDQFGLGGNVVGSLLFG